MVLTVSIRDPTNTTSTHLPEPKSCRMSLIGFQLRLTSLRRPLWNVVVYGVGLQLARNAVVEVAVWLHLRFGVVQPYVCNT